MAGYEHCMSETHSIEVTKACTLSPNCSVFTNKFHKHNFESYRATVQLFAFLAIETRISGWLKKILLSFYGPVL